jgi:hypothetical protein
MRKEKFSYVILLAEIAAIVWLHSIKPSENKQVSPGNIVSAATSVRPQAPHVKYIQAVHR